MQIQSSDCSTLSVPYGLFDHPNPTFLHLQMQRLEHGGDSPIIRGANNKRKMWTLLYTQAESRTQTNPLARSLAAKVWVRVVPCTLFINFKGSQRGGGTKKTHPTLAGTICFQVFNCTFNACKTFCVWGPLSHIQAQHSTHTFNRIFHIRFKDVAPRRLPNFCVFQMTLYPVYLNFWFSDTRICVQFADLDRFWTRKKTNADPVWPPLDRSNIPWEFTA